MEECKTLTFGLFVRCVMQDLFKLWRIPPILIKFASQNVFPMLQIENLSLKYGNQQVLKDVSLTVMPGEIACICGESGCGKSSLFKAVLGFVDADGYIAVCGEVLSPLTVYSIRKNIAYVPQELALPAETVEEMVRMPFELKANKHVPYSYDLLMEEWKWLGLEPGLLNKYTNEISGGQRQRIMLGVSGMLRKPLLLADEPTSALDGDSAHHVLDYFRMLADKRGMAVAVVSHARELVDGCDKVLRL